VIGNIDIGRPEFHQGIKRIVNGLDA